MSPRSAKPGRVVIQLGDDHIKPRPQQARAVRRVLRPPDARRGGSGSSAIEEEPGDRDFIPDVRLAHGDVLAGDGWTLECLHTPGHISNHLRFAFVEERGLFTGDHVMGWSSTIIPPPDGNLGDYLRSLQLPIDRGERDRVFWPTHGPPITSPVRFARALLAHRHRRTAQILECLRDGPATIPALVARMYTETPKILHPAAERSVLARLIHLTEQRRVASEPAADDRATTYALAQGDPRYIGSAGIETGWGDETSVGPQSESDG